MINVLTGRFWCEIPNCNCHADRENYESTLYESIFKLVAALANQYKKTCRDNTEDLMQRCFERIHQNLHQFDPELGFQFSTWAWHVSENVLRKEAKKTVRYNKAFVDFEPVHETAIDQRINGDFVGVDIVAARRELCRLYPRWRDVIERMLGTEGGELPNNLVVAELARTTHRRYNQVHIFLTRIVRPFFYERFNQIRGNR
jgi:DNA-directed RNA polymerase specialized sigma24 family protein